MRVEYLGLKTVDGPLIVVEGVSGAQYEELVEIILADADGTEHERIAGL